MRTTLTLDDDVAARLRQEVAKRKRPLKQVVNDVMRAGFDSTHVAPAKTRPYVMKTFDLGECLVDNLDNIEEVLDRVDGPWRR